MNEESNSSGEGSGSIPAPGSLPFQPTMLGQPVLWSDEQGNIVGKGMITDENETEIYI